MNEEKFKRAALIISTLGSFLTPFGGASINIALPSIGKEFGMNAITLNWVVTAYLLSSAMLIVPFGKLGDISGRKRIFNIGIWIFTIISFILIFSNSPFMIISLRIIQGIGGAMIHTNGVAIVTSIFPPGERGKVLGINLAAVYSGISLGPFLGGFLTQQFGWRSIFFVNIILGGIIIAFILWQLKGEWAEAKGESFDLKGSVIYSLTLITIMYGFSLLPSTSGIWLLLCGFLGIVLFIKLELMVTDPIWDMRLFINNKALAFSNLAAFIHYSATYAVSFLLSLYLQLIKGISPQNAGIILVSQPVMQAIFSPFAGRLSDRIEPQIVASIGLAITTIGLSMFIFLSNDTRLVFIIMSLIILGFGFSLFSSPNTNAVMGCVEKRFYGVVSGILGTMRMTGQMFSMGVVMIIFSILIGRVQILPNYYPQFLKSLRVAFLLFSILCFLGIFASLARGKVHEDS